MRVSTSRIDPESLCQTTEEQDLFIADANKTGQTEVIANAQAIVERAKKKASSCFSG
ncbi:hypothetical protein [Acetobacter tropicalis]|uniref:hypothetical protein n=1 Tax=Acetobacter tropicalis TaxID=104102 RepID=UPI0012E00AB7|nr:hypothetical protein [Acetobacter tropicalis]MBC9010291.1 hypothetical protein [Acetobacter tropicalis]MDO8171905.1 hypothetical protein [Acetobacter tropicalis]